MASQAMAEVGLSSTTVDVSRGHASIECAADAHKVAAGVTVLGGVKIDDVA